MEPAVVLEAVRIWLLRGSWWRRRQGLRRVSTLLLQCLFRVRPIVCMEIVRSTEALATSRIRACVRALACVNEHVALQMLVTLETPAAMWVVAYMLVLFTRLSS